jgi:hypothetical protein
MVSGRIANIGRRAFPRSAEGLTQSRKEEEKPQIAQIEEHSKSV